jgi:hypothetical protein
VVVLANQMGLNNPDVKDDAGRRRWAQRISAPGEFSPRDNLKTLASWQRESLGAVEAQRSETFRGDMRYEPRPANADPLTAPHRVKSGSEYIRQCSKPAVRPRNKRSRRC